MFLRQIQRILRNRSYYSRLVLGSIFPISPSRIFSGVPDEGWFWLNTEGYRNRRLLRNILPSMPPDDLQKKIVGNAGDETLREGFTGYKLFKSLYEKHAGTIGDCSAILDFGCGWGRILRFFLRDLDTERLWGSDCRRDLIEICKRTNNWCQFRLNDALPPTLFQDNAFDLVYCYSVFSHLAEDIHRDWLQEFRRILRPGGLLIVTTWRREFLEWCAALRADSSLECEPNWRKQLAFAFQDTKKSLADYDAGQFCFSEYDRHADAWAWLNGKPYYGEACIPQTYVVKVWTEYFDFLEFIDDRSLCPQNVIVLRKR